jgi:hypothetical protein
VDVASKSQKGRGPVYYGFTESAGQRVRADSRRAHNRHTSELQRLEEEHAKGPDQLASVSARPCAVVIRESWRGTVLRLAEDASVLPLGIDE